MSGDVTAAIERLRKFSKLNLFQSYIHEDGRYTVSHDIDTVLEAHTEAERKVANWDGIDSWVVANLIDERDSAKAEVERLRAERAIMLIDFEHVVDERNGLLAQQAGVASLHFETEGVHTHTVCAHRYCVDDSHDQHEWPCPTAIAAGLAAPEPTQ